MKRKNMIILIILLIAALGMSAISYFGIDAPELGLNKTLSAENIKKGLDLSGGVYIVYQAKDSEGNLMNDPSGDDMSAASQLLRTRLDLSGWTDGEVSIEGGNRLRVEIPGIDNAEEAIKGIGQAGVLAFLDETGNVVVSGDKVANASVGISDSGTGKAGYYCINLEFNSEGAGDFKTATENNIGKPIYITLDGVPLSWPTVQNVIPNGRATITGEFGKEEATTLANLINSGSLPFSLEVIEQQSIGATLGADALSTSLFAGLVGIILVIIFMIIFYRFSGIAADWALIIYLSAELIILNGLNITLTLPGIAGIILSVGMAVDANVIIFERIKEELSAGRTLRLALENGFSRAFPAIVDSNITTLIACAVLFWLGTGPIRGFAQTLAIGIVLSMFTALVITRFIVKGFVGVGIKNPKFFGGK
ncbi:MAG: protein translocase subunit SecD [Clostridiales bacterium]|nr:protein translocase subunit SecD [Clostridiales bacterium]